MSSRLTVRVSLSLSLTVRVTVVIVLKVSVCYGAGIFVLVCLPGTFTGILLVSKIEQA